MFEKNIKGWTVTLSGVGINLALGLLYTWSIFKEAIKSSIENNDNHFTWNLSNLNDPYSVCCLFSSFTMMFAGRIQDKISPKFTAIIGGILTGTGLIWSSLSYSWIVWILGFGILTGTGISFAYSATIPPAIKWFPANKTGLIAGIVVAGFGLAPAYIAPLAQLLIGKFGLSFTMMFFGITSSIIVCSLGMLLVNPPSVNEIPKNNIVKPNSNSYDYLPEDVINFSPREIIKNITFYKLGIMFCFSAGAGLMVIGNVAGMAKQCLGNFAWIGVTLMALGNASGRIISGIISDKIGRLYTMAITMSLQALLMFTLLGVTNYHNSFFMLIISIFIGFNYGSNLSLFPAVTRDYFGLKNFGANYGLLLIFWGLGGFILPKLSQLAMATTGSYNFVYILAGSLLIISASLTFLIKIPVKNN